MENPKDYRIKIVTGNYHLASPEQKQMIQELFGENAEHKYEIYFHWYNVLHELGHAIMMFNAASRPHPAEEEQLVNNFAYAYWKYYGEQEKLDYLCSIVNETIQRFSTPTHNNESYLDYVKNVWGTEELYSFNNYGWFQFSSVQAATKESPNLEQALNRMCSTKVSPQPVKTLKYDIDHQMASRIVADAVKLLKEWDVLLPDGNEIVFCDDVNCHMCQVENIYDGRVF